MTDWNALADRFDRFNYIPRDFGEACSELCRAMAARAEPTGILECDGPIRPVMHCYVRQRAAVEALLGRPWDMRLRAVRDVSAMRGIESGTFVVVLGHPDRVPSDMCALIQTGGWIVLRVSAAEREWIRAVKSSLS